MSEACTQWIRNIEAQHLPHHGIERFPASADVAYMINVPVIRQQVQLMPPSMQQIFLTKTIPDIVREEIARPKQTIYYPDTKKVLIRIRLYPAFMWGGDWHYQHRDGIDADIAQQVYFTRLKHQRSIGVHVHFEQEMFHNLRASGGTMADLDVPVFVEKFLHEHPEYSLT